MSYTAMKLRANQKITQYDFDPNVDTLVDVAWVDMKDFTNFLVGFFRTIGTSATVLKILGNAASDGSGTDVVVATKTLTSAEPNAVGDTTWMEVTAEQVKAAAVAAGITGVRYVSANISFVTSTDEGVVTYILGGPRFAYADLTADVIA